MIYSFFLRSLFPDKRLGHIPVQAGVGEAARRGTREAAETGFRLPNRRVLRAATPHPPSTHRHELRINEDNTAGQRR